MKRERKDPKKFSPQERILADCIPEPNSGCWLWTRANQKGGYGNLWYYGKCWLAHRFSYEAFIGKIPEGQFVLHKCDQPCCVNPDHFFLGSWLENARDMVAKNRRAPTFGTKNPRAILTEDQVLEIFNSPKGTKGLEKLYGVTRTTILDIRKQKQWKSVTMNQEQK